jgi:uncharacterized protein (DUF1330 family)
MPAYLIADVTVTDPETYDRYRREVPASIAAFGGRFLVRGGASEVVEGDWRPRRLVILEFPDADALRRWYHSDAYQEVAKLRWAAADANIVFADGV